MVQLEYDFFDYAPTKYVALFEELYYLANRKIDFRSFKDRVIEVRRVSKVQTAGRKLSFRVTVVTGNGNGLVGLGIGKSGLVREAVRKAVIKA